MKNFLENHKIKIQALSPIHIGDGRKIGKKEYIRIPWERKVIIPDSAKLFASLCKKGLEQAYTDYMLNGYSDLGPWLKEQQFTTSDYQQWKLYEMDCGDAFTSIGARAARPKEITSFIKDGYGMPYIPGSSLKGLLRTALLASEASHNPGTYRQIAESIRRNSMQESKRTACLAKDTDDLESMAFHTLQREKNDKNNAHNSCMSGLIVRDSQPLSPKNLTLSQKIDYSLDGKEKPLPILRESLIPGTEVYFDISIDKSQCSYTIKDIMAALEEFQQCQYRHFYSRFHRGTDEKGIVWIGGGCGFLSKTVLYPIFKEEAVKISDAVFKNTLGKNYRVHKHDKDLSLKLAPHVCKCTRYNGRLYDMGMGKISLLENT